MHIASQLVVYQIQSAWLQIQKMGDKIASKYDASLSMAFVLMAIFEESGTPVTKIAPRIGMEPNSLSRLLKRLEKKNYIYKQKDKADKRIVLIRLTELGKDRREVALRAVFQMEKTLIKKLTNQDLQGFFKVMNAVNTLG